MDRNDSAIRSVLFLIAVVRNGKCERPVGGRNAVHADALASERSGMLFGTIIVPAIADLPEERAHTTDVARCWYSGIRRGRVR